MTVPRAVIIPPFGKAHPVCESCGDREGVAALVTADGASAREGLLLSIWTAEADAPASATRYCRICTAALVTELLRKS